MKNSNIIDLEGLPKFALRPPFRTSMLLLPLWEASKPPEKTSSSSEHEIAASVSGLFTPNLNLDPKSWAIQYGTVEAQFNYVLFRNTGTCFTVALVSHEICVSNVEKSTSTSLDLKCANTVLLEIKITRVPSRLRCVNIIFGVFIQPVLRIRDSVPFRPPGSGIREG